MIIEIIGPPGIGKSYYGSKVLEFNNEIYSDTDIINKLSIIFEEWLSYFILYASISDQETMPLSCMLCRPQCPSENKNLEYGW